MTNYHKESLKIIESFDEKKSLLLHVCCGICSCYPISFLDKYFNITIIFNNSNIYPLEEYNKRKNTLIEHIQKYYKHIKIIEPEYNNIEYDNKVKHLKDLPEKGLRCHLCYEIRIKQAYDYADANKFDYVTTVMTVSRHKDSNIINNIGLRLEKDYSFTKYFISDFKKNDGSLKTNKEARENNMYRQSYCGCKYSIKS